jgi:hypothetical protein
MSADLPAAAADALWGAGMMNVWTPGTPLPCAPSADVARERILTADETVRYLLTATARNDALVTELVEYAPTCAAYAGAAANPHTSSDVLHVAAGLPGSVSVPPQDDQQDLVSSAARLAADRLAFRSKPLPGANDDAFEWLKRAVELADAVPAVNAYGANSNVTAAVDKMMTAVLWSQTTAPHRAFRGAFLDHLASVGRTNELLDLAVRIATTRDECFDTGVVRHIDAAVNVGRLDVSDLAGRFDTDGAALAHGERLTIASRVTSDQAPRLLGVARTAVIEEEQHSSVDADLLSILGFDAAAARVGVQASRTADGEDFINHLMNGEEDVIADWLECRLQQQPGTQQLVEVFLGLDDVKRTAVLEEMNRRGNPLNRNPDMILVLPELTTRDVPDKAVRILRAALLRELGPSADAWPIVATLLNDDLGVPAVELVELAKHLI